MKKLELTKVERALLSLLRASLQGEVVNNSSLESFTDKDWNLLYSLSKKQGVAALVWDGIQMLPSELQPPRTIKIVWALYVEQCEKKYIHYVRVIAELTDFFAQYRIGTVLLKGVGLSPLYLHPEHRECGDLDIYTYSLDKAKLSDDEARALSNKLIEEKGIEVDYKHPKHCIFNYKGIPIENHNFFLDKNIIKTAGFLNLFLSQIISPHNVSLLDGHVSVSIPSDDFNAIFVSYHAIQHLRMGLCLHHLCDWAYILNHCDLEFLNKIENKKYIKLVKILSQITNNYLGSHVDIQVNTEEMNLILLEILRSPYLSKLNGTGKFNILLYKLKRFAYIIKLRNQFVEDSILHYIWKSICFKIKHPDTIFKEKDEIIS